MIMSIDLPVTQKVISVSCFRLGAIATAINDASFNRRCYCLNPLAIKQFLRIRLLFIKQTTTMEASQANKSRITTSEFSAKFRSKNEVYSFLSIDVAAYLPPPECATIYFLKDLVNGKKRCKFARQLISLIQISSLLT